MDVYNDNTRLFDEENTIMKYLGFTHSKHGKQSASKNPQVAVRWTATRGGNFSTEINYPKHS